MRNRPRSTVIALFISFVWAIFGVQAETLASQVPDDRVRKVDIQILSTNLANGATTGEWGLSALVRADDHCILFDAGRFPETVVKNAKALNVDLTCVTKIVLSHFHFDHTGGLELLIEEIKKADPDRRIETYVATGFFEPRQLDMDHPGVQAMVTAFGTTQWNLMVDKKERLVELGLDFIEIDAPTQIAQGVWATGPIERRYKEELYPAWSLLPSADGGFDVDHVPDSQGLVVKTNEGPIILVGCGHSGSVNLVTQVRAEIQDAPPLALMGGLHLFNASDTTLAWTADKLKELGVQHLMAGHCTGVYPMQYLQQALGLTRKTAVIGAVGARFELGHGIHPTAIAH